MEGFSEMNTLRPHQFQTLTKCLGSFEQGSKSFLIASEVGVGKTRPAIAVAKEFQNLSKNKILVVAPLSTFGGWLRESEIMGWNLKTVSESVTGWPGNFPTIVNYEKLDKFKEIGQWSEDPKHYIAQTFDLIIWDEAHRLRGRATKRSKMFEALYAKATHNLFLTATPGQSPLDLAYLKDVIGFKSFWPWVRSFKGVVANRWGGLDFKSTSIEDRRRLEKVVENNPLAIRHTPQQIAGWPELQREIFPIKLDARQSEFYHQAMEDYIKSREDSGSRLSPEAYDMIAVGQFRKRISDLRVPATIELADTLISQGKVVTIACEYLNPAKIIHENLTKKGWRVGVITGAVNSPQRAFVLSQSVKDELDCIIFTVEEGINLQQMEDNHRERVQIDHDLQWSGLAQHQIDGRTHRAGRFALVYWMTVADTVDDRVAKVMKKRLSVMNSINGQVEDFQINMDNYIYGEPKQEGMAI
jgi:hypothetical protein